MNSFRLSGSTSQGGDHISPEPITSLFFPVPPYSPASPHCMSSPPPIVHGTANMALPVNTWLSLPQLTSFPWPPTTHRVVSTASCYSGPFTSFPSVLCPALPLSTLFVFKHCGQEISVLLEMFEHTEKQFIDSKICKANCIEANPHLIIYLRNTPACLFYIYIYI